MSLSSHLDQSSTPLYTTASAELDISQPLTCKATEIMPTYARIAFAKQQIAKKIDQHTDNGHYVMVKQVRPGNLPVTFESPPQIYSPTSAPLHPGKPLKISRTPKTTQNLPPTQQFKAILNASIHETSSPSRLTPTERFEKLLNDDLEARVKLEMERKAE